MALADAFWPGGLTLVVPRGADRTNATIAGTARATVGLRVPDHEAPRALAAALGPLPTTSANRSGEPEARDADEIEASSGDAVDLILDGGPARGGPASTVVDVTVEPPRILRVGAVGDRRHRSAVCPRTRLPGRGKIGGQRPPVARTGGRERAAGRSRDDAGAGDGARLGAARRRRSRAVGRHAPGAVRQRDKIELIASENYIFAAVMEAQGSWLTNKYAEGLPGKRYYGGCEYVDIAENARQQRALALFPGAEHVNVQPHSGAQANMAAYFSVLSPGDRILGMNLAHGGHLTHGSPVNFSGRLYEVHAYGVDRETERIDYDALEAASPRRSARSSSSPARRPTRASSTSRAWPTIAHGVGALLFVDMAHIAGLVAAGVHPSPFPHADIVTTTTHKTLRGPRGGLIFSREELPDAVDRADFPMVKRTLGARIDKTVFPGVQGGPLMHVVAAKAVGLRLAAERAVPARPAADRRERGRCWPMPSRSAARGSSPAARTTTSCSST